NSDSEANAAVEHLTRQMVLLQRAKIMTIHAFCLDLLREYGYALDLNAKSHIGSEGELNLLREKVLDDVFEAAYAEPDSDLRLLLRHYSRGLGDDNIRALVLRLIEFGQSMPDIEFKRLPAVRKTDNPDPEAKECVQLLRKQVKDRVAALLREAAPIIHGTLAAELQEQAPLAEALINLTLNFYHAWHQAKRRRRLLEFADLEHYVLDLLQNEQLGVAASLQQ
ncbi:MAG: UvrD-helicase domain-containing protein, partial [Firmicutes bacterium]|nr:UvrD-helicase domain-containing protein [Bacillota bacterium]